MIICSAGKGELDEKACLECALSSPLRHPPCGFDYGFLKALFDQEDRSQEIHVTDILGCLKKAYLDKTDPQPVHVHDLIVLAMGRAVHGRMEASDPVSESETSLLYNGLMGRPDLVYQEGRIVDYKTTRWMVPSKLPYGSHAKQVNVYAHMRRKLGYPVSSAALMYIDLSGPTKCRACKKIVRLIDGDLKCPVCLRTVPNAHLGATLIEVELMDERYIEEYVNRQIARLRGALSNGHIPEADPDYLCGYCSHTEECEEGQEFLYKEGKDGR